MRPIGGLDERFGLGFFDDDDLAERARRAGFELAVAHDLFVHHFGSRTFAGNGIDAEALLRRERAAVRRQVGARDAARPSGRAAAVGWALGLSRRDAKAGCRGAGRPASPDASRIDPASRSAPLRSSAASRRETDPDGPGQPDHDRPGRGGEPAALPGVGAGDLR